MLFFGYTIDKIGRRTGIVFATLFLILGVILATAAHGNVCRSVVLGVHIDANFEQSELGLFWMM